MYIIEDGKAYLVDGEVGYFTNFDKTGKMVVDKEKTIDVEGKQVYTYDEMYAKLNIAFMVEEAKRKDALKSLESEELDKLNSKIEELEKENKELKSLIEELEKSNEEEPKVEDEPEKVEDEPKEEKNKKENK